MIEFERRLRVATAYLAASAAIVAVVGCNYGEPPSHASSPGAVRIAKSTDRYESIYRFAGSPDGSVPFSRVVSLGRMIYGTTSAGGECLGAGCGVVFTISASGSESVLHRFAGVPDGAEPMAELTPIGHVLYGTTYTGGRLCANGEPGCGTVFTIDTVGRERVLYRFRGEADGAYPDGPLIAVGNVLYGTTLSGGSSCNCGTVFSIDKDGHELVLYRFMGKPDASGPTGSLVYLDGKLYGASGGGANGVGAVFSITTTGKERVIYSSTGQPDMASPSGLVAMAGKLYGTSQYGGANGRGAAYYVTPDGSERVIHSFSSSPMNHGFWPSGRLIAVNGLLYGTTQAGGANIYSCHGSGCGVVFSMTPSGRESVLHQFKGGPDGVAPFAGVTDVLGDLYGTTAYGGAFVSLCPHGCGTLFHIAR